MRSLLFSKKTVYVFAAIAAVIYLLAYNNTELRYDRSVLKTTDALPLSALEATAAGEAFDPKYGEGLSIHLKFLPADFKDRNLFKTGAPENGLAIWLGTANTLAIQTGYTGSYPYPVSIATNLEDGKEIEVEVVFENIYPRTITAYVDGAQKIRLIDANLVLHASSPRVDMPQAVSAPNPPSFSLTKYGYIESPLFKSLRAVGGLLLFLFLAFMTYDYRLLLRNLFSPQEAISREVPLLAGFAVVAAMFVFYPLYFQWPTTSRTFEFIPSSGEILGCDLRSRRIDFLRWWSSGQTDSSWLEKIFFLPFSFFEQTTAFRILSTVTIVSNFFNSFIFPRLFVKGQRLDNSYLLIGVSTFFSFGFLFELQQGQFYSFLFTLVLLSLCIYHRFPQRRLWAYALLSIAIQVKVVPALFLLLMCEDYSKWREHWRRMLMVGILNLIPLILTNLTYFKLLVSIATAGTPITLENSPHHFMMFYQLSLKSLSIMLVRATEFPFPRLLIFAGYLLVSLGIAYAYITCIKRKEKGISGLLLLLSAIAVLVIPADSIIYKLPIVSSAFAYYWVRIEGPHSRAYLFALSLVYFWTTIVAGQFRMPDRELTWIAILVGHNAVPLLLMCIVVLLHHWWQSQFKSRQPT